MERRYEPRKDVAHVFDVVRDAELTPDHDLFESRTGGPPLTSPTAHVADVGGKRISAWPVGEKFMCRWRDGGLGFSLVGNVPPDVAWDFLVADVGPGGPLASRAQTADAAAGAKAAP